MRDKLPNFLIVGAAKSGTSSLHNYLSQHPDIFMPSYDKRGMKVKEPRFLIKDLVQERLRSGVWSWKEYQSLFDDVRSEQSIGEATVLYLYYYNLAIKNIKYYLGDDVKIIIMLRNPTERAFSAYVQTSLGIQESLSFEEALNIEKDRLKKDPLLTPMVMYKEMGLYYDMVASYKKNFKDVHVIIYDDFKKNTAKTVAETVSFLGLNPCPSLQTNSNYNVGGKKWNSHSIKHLFMKENFLKIFFRITLPYALRIKIRSALELLFKEKIQPIHLETRKQLITFFKDDISKLEELLVVDLRKWKE